MARMTSVALPDFEERLLGSRELGRRWGEHPKVAYSKAVRLGAARVRFNSRCIKFKLSEIVRIEQEATIGAEA
jgi:hypothetical protein